MKDTKKDISIYVHIPFCVRKCLYCDFLSFCADEGLVDSYFDALGKEISACAEDYKDYNVRSIFFGGGTPSYVEAKYICGTLKEIYDKFSVSSDAEISIEVNPGTVTEDKLKCYFDAGINRLSIGAQSMDNDELKRLGRIHDHETLLETYKMARKIGFTNINIDLMSGIPNQKPEDFLKNLEKTVELSPEHISAYSLIVEEGTPFYDMDLELPTEEEDRQMYHETKRFLESKGYHRYEISNYALNGAADSAAIGGGNSDGNCIEAEFEKYESFHNKVYWKRGNYLGLGLGASSMVDNVRWKNESDIRKFISIMTGENIDDLNGINPERNNVLHADSNNCNDADVLKTEVSNHKAMTVDDKNEAALEKLRQEVQKLTTDECMEEFMFLGLRLTKGISISEFERQFGKNIRDVYGKVIDKYADLGLLEICGDYLRLSEKGLDVSNTVMADFLLD